MTESPCGCFFYPVNLLNESNRQITVSRQHKNSSKILPTGLNKIIGISNTNSMVQKKIQDVRNFEAGSFMTEDSVTSVFVILSHNICL